MTTICDEPLTTAGFTDLVWDADRRCVARPRDLQARDPHGFDWAPDQLLAMAVGASVMSTFMTFASEHQLTVLGYVSRQRAEPRAGAPGRIALIVAPCITVRSPAAALMARLLADQAFAAAPMAQAVKSPIRLDARVAVAPAEDPDQEC